MFKALKNPLIAFASLVVLGMILLFGTDAYIQLTATLVLVNIILAMSLNLLNGYTGQFSLGHAGFMAVGAYTSVFVSAKLPLFQGELAWLNFFYSVYLAGLLSAGFGFLLGQPSLRLKGDYLAIVTLGFGEIIRVALLNMDFLGGARGWGGYPVFPNFIVGWSFACIWILVTFFTIWRLMRSSFGRGFLSVREDEVAAAAMGIDTTETKVRSFILSAFFAGVAGALYAHFNNYISPNSFGFLLSVNGVIMVVLGGMGSMTGSIVAAILISILPEGLRFLQEFTGVDLRMVIYSLMLILMMLLRPKGLFGKTELNEILGKYIQRWRQKNV